MICETCGVPKHDGCEFNNCPTPAHWSFQMFGGSLDGAWLHLCRPGDCQCGGCED